MGGGRPQPPLPITSRALPLLPPTSCFQPPISYAPRPSYFIAANRVMGGGSSSQPPPRSRSHLPRSHLPTPAVAAARVYRDDAAAREAQELQLALEISRQEISRQETSRQDAEARPPHHATSPLQPPSLHPAACSLQPAPYSRLPAVAVLIAWRGGGALHSRGNGAVKSPQPPTPNLSPLAPHP